MYGPIGTWRRKCVPWSASLRSSRQRRRSASVALVRNRWAVPNRKRRRLSDTVHPTPPPPAATLPLQGRVGSEYAAPRGRQARAVFLTADAFTKVPQHLPRPRRQPGLAAGLGELAHA